MLWFERRDKVTAARGEYSASTLAAAAYLFWHTENVFILCSINATKCTRCCLFCECRIVTFPYLHICAKLISFLLDEFNGRMIVPMYLFPKGFSLNYFCMFSTRSTYTHYARFSFSQWILFVFIRFIVLKGTGGCSSTQEEKRPSIFLGTTAATGEVSKGTFEKLYRRNFLELQIIAVWPFREK